MKNQIYILLTLFIFLIVSFAYTQGVFDGGNSENQEEFSTTQPIAPSVVQSDNSGSPSADNVSNSYYQTVTELEGYLSTHPSDTTHVLRLARLYHEGHQSEKASQWYEKYLELKPHDVQTHLDLANTYGESGAWDHALSVTDRLLQLDPENDEALYNKGAILANQGKFEEAKVIWEGIMELDTNSDIKEKVQGSLERLSQM